MVQDSGKKITLFRSSGRGEYRRTLPPRPSGSRALNSTCASSSMSSFRRRLAMRNCSPVPSLYGAITARPAEEHRGGRPGKAGEQQPRRQRLIHQADQRLDGHDEVGRQAVGADLAVPIVANVWMLKKNARPKRPPSIWRRDRAALGAARDEQQREDRLSTR